MHTASHGGGCCGVFHLMGCDTSPLTLAQLRTEVQKGNNGMMAEVVATDGQLRSDPRLRSVFEEAGFTLVYRFQNPNSRNYCNVFLNSTAKDDISNTPKGADLKEIEAKEAARAGAEAKTPTPRWRSIGTFWRSRPQTTQGLRCRITSPRSMYHGYESTILSDRMSERCRTLHGTFIWGSIEILR